MKTILTEGGRDFIINETTRVLYVNNKPDWINQETKLANFRGDISSIVFYEDEYKEGYPTGTAKKMQIDVQSIKKLHELILQIEAKRTSETYYEGIDW